VGAPRGTGGGTPRKVNPRVHERRGGTTSVYARIKHKRETEGERNVREDEGRARRAALRAGRVGCSAHSSPVWIGRGRGGAQEGERLGAEGECAECVRRRWRWRGSRRVGKEDDAVASDALAVYVIVVVSPPHG
jgi:hypothetical protein